MQGELVNTNTYNSGEELPPRYNKCNLFCVWRRTCGEKRCVSEHYWRSRSGSQECAFLAPLSVWSESQFHGWVIKRRMLSKCYHSILPFPRGIFEEALKVGSKSPHLVCEWMKGRYLVSTQTSSSDLLFKAALPCGLPGAYGATWEQYLAHLPT